MDHPWFDRRIVKVQVQLTEKPGCQVAICEKRRKNLFVGDMPPDIAKQMPNKLTAYFYSSFVEGKLKLGEKAPKQDW